MDNLWVCSPLREEIMDDQVKVREISMLDLIFGAREVSYLCVLYFKQYWSQKQ